MPSKHRIELCATFSVFPVVISGRSPCHLGAWSVLPKASPSPTQKAGATGPVDSVYRPGLGAGMRDVRFRMFQVRRGMRDLGCAMSAEAGCGMRDG